MNLHYKYIHTLGSTRLLLMTRKYNIYQD